MRRSIPDSMLRGLLATAILAVGMVSTAGSAESTATLEANKKTAIAFYEAAINRKDFAAASGYLGAQYKQHNPTAQDGPEGLKAFIDFLKAKFPMQKGEIKQVIAEGDKVALHVHSTRGDGTPGRAIVDIFRLQNGKVVEHWDVIQDIPEKASNSNGMF